MTTQNHNGHSWGATYEDFPIPAGLKEQAKEYREKLLEAVSDYDDKLLEKFVHDEPIQPKEIIAALRKAVIDVKIIPVLCGASFRNRGVQKLLDAVVEFLPSPADLPPVKGTSLSHDQTLERRASDSEPFAGLAFK